MGKLVKNTALISLLTLGSRILGVVRDALIAMVFGTSLHSDAFFLAFRPFDLVRKLFSEGILSISFIPVFSQVLEKEGKSNAVSMVFSFLCFLSFLAVSIMLTGFLLAPWLIKLVAPGFVNDPAVYGLTVYLFKTMLPYFWSVLIMSLCMGVLNTFGNFGAPAVAPLVFNLAVICFTLFICNFFHVPVKGLAWGVTIGGLVQLMVQIPFMIRVGMLKFHFSKLYHPGILKVFKILIPCMIGAASYQINIMVASFFASRLDEGSVSFLYFADRLVQFPLALFAVSVATVYLPEFSRRAGTGKPDDAALMFSKGIKMVLFVTIPAMAGLMALDHEIVSFLFSRGRFDAHAIEKTASCLFFLVTGLWAFTGTRIIITLYYAFSRIKIPFYSGLFSIGVNFLFCALFVDRFGLKGLVLSVSMASGVGFLLLFIQMPFVALIVKKDILVSACRSFFLSAIMFFFVEQVTLLLPGSYTGKFESGITLAGGILLGVFCYLGLNMLISSPELRLLKQGICKQSK